MEDSDPKSLQVQVWWSDIFVWGQRFAACLLFKTVKYIVYDINLIRSLNNFGHTRIPLSQLKKKWKQKRTPHKFLKMMKTSSNLKSKTLENKIDSISFLFLINIIFRSPPVQLADKPTSPLEHSRTSSPQKSLISGLSKNE